MLLKNTSGSQIIFGLANTAPKIVIKLILIKLITFFIFKILSSSNTYKNKGATAGIMLAFIPMQTPDKKRKLFMISQN